MYSVVKHAKAEDSAALSIELNFNLFREAIGGAIAEEEKELCEFVPEDHHACHKCKHKSCIDSEAERDSHNLYGVLEPLNVSMLSV